MSATGALYQETEPGLFVRRCIGAENFFSAASDADPVGFGHCTFSASVTFHEDIVPLRLESFILRALVRLRHLVPAIASRISKLPKAGYQFSYRVPRSLDEALSWADAVIYLHKTGSNFEENHERVGRERFWAAKEDRYSLGLLVSPISPNSVSAHRSWAFSLSGHHGNLDGRSAWMLLDQVFTFLTDELNGRGPALEKLKWGEETRRLPMAAPMIWAVEESGSPEPLPLPPAMPVRPEAYIPWLFENLSTADIGTELSFNVYDHLVFSPDETTRFHAVCKKHGRTITQVATAIVLLAHAEASFRIAGKSGQKHFEKVMELYGTATHLLIGQNTVSVRPRLPKPYREFGIDHSTPLMCSEAVPLSFALEPYKSLVKPDAENLSAKRVFNEACFWDEIVQDAANQWKDQDFSPDASRSRAALYEILSSPEQLELSIFAPLGPVLTSFGDMTRLNLFESFRPSTLSLSENGLIVNELDVSVRGFYSAALHILFEYDGRLHMKLGGDRRLASEDDMRLRKYILKEWFHLIL